jgi:hypothetical protein
MARERRRAFNADQLAGLLFFLFVAAGCAYIIYSKSIRFSAWETTAIPVVIMLSYAAIIATVRLLRLRDDQAGDNLYYMGFLFTLTSLGMSLYQFRADAAAEEIVRNFGVAVASTIAGVALRVLFNQMRRDPVETEQAARLELAEASRRVRRELDNTALEMAHFRRASQQAMLDGFQEVRRGAAALNASSAEALQVSVTRITGECGRLVDGISRTSAELAHLTDRFAMVETPDHPLGSRIEPVLAELKEVIERLDRRAEERLEREVEAAATLSAAVEALADMTRQAELTAAYRGRTAGKPKGAPDRAGPRRLRDRLSEWGTRVGPFGRRGADEKGRG